MSNKIMLQNIIAEYLRVLTLRYTTLSQTDPKNKIKFVFDGVSSMTQCREID